VASLPVAVATSLGGAVVGLGSVLAQVGNDSDLGPWVSGGGAFAAVSGLVYVAKKFADGSIVARDVAESERAATHREDELKALIKEGRDREDGYRAFLMGRRVQGQ
jgi:hypothetical protein